MTKSVEDDLTQYLVSFLDVDRFVGLDNAILNYLFAYLQSGACTGVEDAIEQLSEILPSWGVCSFEECSEVCSQIGLIAARHNKLLEEKEQNQQLLKEQREKLSSLRSNPQKSAESFVRGVVRPRVLAPHHLRNKEIVKKTDGPDPNEEKFQDPNSSTRLTLIPDLMDVVIVKPAHADRSNPDEIRISEFSMSFSGRALLNNAGLFIQRGRRYGLIGRNGVGKSTLLRHIARGSFNLLNSPDILFIEQEVPGNDASPLEWVLAADVRRTEMLKEEQRLLGLIESTPAAADGDARAKEKELARKKEQEDAKKVDVGEGQGKDGEGEGSGEDSYSSTSSSSSSSTNKKVKRTVAATQSLSAAISTAAAATVSDDTAPGLLELYDRMSEMQFETQETRAKMILKGLGFSEEDFGIPSKLFSGGWRMRISLARALFREPTFLFLDEPTNHLDLPGALWLEHFLKEYKRGLVIVSHDRYFLNRVCTDIIYFANETLSPFRGDYSQFEIMHEEQRKHQQKAYESQQKQIEKMQAFIIYNRAKSEKLASAAQSRMKLLDKMEKIEAPTEEQYNLTFRFPELGSNIKSPFLTMEHLSFAYTVGKPILENVSLIVGLNSRIALVGKNGAGKSTLLKLMGKQLEPSAGDLWQRPSLSFVRFSQHAVDEMPHDLDPLTYLYQSVSTLQEYQPPKGNEKLRQHMAQFGVTSQNATKNLGKLSGGERMRVALAKMTLNRRPHLLLLDEPTNHLDLEAREALANALKAYGGAVIIVTHDQFLITNTCTEIWIVEDKKVIPF